MTCFCEKCEKFFLIERNLQFIKNYCIANADDMKSIMSCLMKTKQAACVFGPYCNRYKGIFNIIISQGIKFETTLENKSNL